MLRGIVRGGLVLLEASYFPVKSIQSLFVRLEKIYLLILKRFEHIFKPKGTVIAQG